MFFRRQTVRKPTFEGDLEKARKAGFATESLPGNRANLSRSGIAAIVEDVPGCPPKVVHRAGVIMGAEIATLVDGGYQKFLQTPSGKRRPALASDLRAIHEFQEDLREALGLISLYNEALGTVSNQYIYDRVEDRDLQRPKEPWEIATPAKPKA